MVGMNERFAERMQDPHVRSDMRIMAGLAAIHCVRRHADRRPFPIESEAALLGVYGRRAPRLCAECAEHLGYAEKRRAFCPKDPKPFCSYCDTHCYSAEESEWQRQMMRFAGPRALFSRYAIPAVRHALEGRRARKTTAPAKEN